MNGKYEKKKMKISQFSIHKNVSFVRTEELILLETYFQRIAVTCSRCVTAEILIYK